MPSSTTTLSPLLFLIHKLQNANACPEDSKMPMQYKSKKEQLTLQGMINPQHAPISNADSRYYAQQHLSTSNKHPTTTKCRTRQCRNHRATHAIIQSIKSCNLITCVPLSLPALACISQMSSYGSSGYVSTLLTSTFEASGSKLTSPAYFPSLVTQTNRNPNLTKHSYTKSIGELISRLKGAGSIQGVKSVGSLIVLSSSLS